MSPTGSTVTGSKRRSTDTSRDGGAGRANVTAGRIAVAIEPQIDTARERVEHQLARSREIERLRTVDVQERPVAKFLRSISCDSSSAVPSVGVTARPSRSPPGLVARSRRTGTVPRPRSR
jgi:hypothetical protein